MLQPKIFSKFVAYFKSDQTNVTKTAAYGYAFALIFLTIINTVYNHNYQQLIMEFSVRIRTALCSVIYRKALKLSADAPSDYSTGKVVTLITKDVYYIDSAVMFANDIWTGVVQIIIVTIMVYNRIGIPIFVGIGFFIMVVPIQSK